MSGFILLCLVIVYCLVAGGLIFASILMEAIDHIRWSRAFLTLSLTMFALLALLLLSIFGGFIVL